MSPVLVVAYGNTLRSDDGVAWRAAELLRPRLSPSTADFVCTHQLVPEIAEDISRAEHVVFIDATVIGTPGEIDCTSIDTNAIWDPSSHRLTPDQLVALCKYAYGAAPGATVVSIAGESFDHGEGLSASVESALPKLIDTVVEVIQKQRASTKSQSASG